MNTSSAVAGSFHENHFNYHQFHYGELRLIQERIKTVSLGTNSP